MARTYIDATENGAKFQTADKHFSKAEATALGNTDFDAILNPITAFNFVLEVEALYFLPLRSVKGFTKENEYEYIREGGVNDYVHLKRKPISKPFTFQVEKYVGTERFLDPLALGTELILPLILYVYRHKSRQGLSEEAPAYPARIYIFTGCTVITKEYGELNAEQSSILTETTTIAYRELIVVPNPFQDKSEKSEWTFKDSKQTDGTYKNKYAAFPPNDAKNSSYAYKFDEKTGQLVMKNGKPAYEMKVNKHNLLYAKPSDIDLEGKVYKVQPRENGIYIVNRADTTNPLLNKPAWDGSNGPVVKWAKEAVPTDVIPNEKAPWDGSDGAKVKWALENATKLDTSMIKESWEGSGGAKVKWAHENATKLDSSMIKAPWEGSGGAKTKWATENTTTLDSSMIKEPWEGSGGAKVKWSLENEAEVPTPVTYPPTKRALMADALKK